jgi:CBS domain-containing protein
MKIKEILETIEERELPLVREHENIAEVVKKVLKYPHTRLIYVVDKEGRCKGSISLGILIRHLFPHGLEPAIHPRFLISMITSETAKDIMNKRLIYATNEDDVEAVIERMIKAGIKEVAILDDEKRVIADLTMLDLLKYHHLVENE